MCNSLLGGERTVASGVNVRRAAVYFDFRLSTTLTILLYSISHNNCGAVVCCLELIGDCNTV